MGQCYSVRVKAKAKEGMHRDIGKAICEFASNRETMDRNCADKIIAQKSLKGAIEAIFGPYEPEPGDAYWKGDEWFAFFHGSYGWEGVMYDAFMAMAPYLEPGSEMSCKPDGRRWTLTVSEDGSVSER